MGNERTELWVELQCPACTYEHQVKLPLLALAGMKEDHDGVYRGLPDDPAFHCRECEHERHAYDAKMEELERETAKEVA